MPDKEESKNEQEPFRTWDDRIKEKAKKEKLSWEERIRKAAEEEEVRTEENDIDYSGGIQTEIQFPDDDDP